MQGQLDPCPTETHILIISGSKGSVLVKLFSVVLLSFCSSVLLKSWALSFLASAIYVSCHVVLLWWSFLFCCKFIFPLSWLHYLRGRAENFCILVHDSDIILQEKNSKKLALLLMSSCQMSGSHSWVNSFYLAYRQIIAYDQSVISPASKWAKGSVGQEAGIKDRLCFQECPWSTIDIPMPWRIYSHSEATEQLFQPYSWNFPGAQAKRKRPHLFE